MQTLLKIDGHRVARLSIGGGKVTVTTVRGQTAREIFGDKCDAVMHEAHQEIARIMRYAQKTQTVAGYVPCSAGATLEEL